MSLKRKRKSKAVVLGLVLASMFLIGCGGPKAGAAPAGGMAEGMDLAADGADALSDGTDMLGQGAGALTEGSELLSDGAQTFAGAGDVTDSIASVSDAGRPVLADSGLGMTAAEDIPDLDMASRGGINNDPGTLVAGPAMFAAPQKSSMDGVLLASTQGLPAKDRWTAAAIAAKEAGSKAQGQADVIHSIQNRTKAPAYGCSSISQCVNKPGQYEPTFGNPSAWRNINSPQSASRATGLPVSTIQNVDRNLNNPSFEAAARSHVGCRTDFQGMSQKRFKKPGDVDRGNGHNFFGNFYPSSGVPGC